MKAAAPSWRSGDRCSGGNDAPIMAGPEGMGAGSGGIDRCPRPVFCDGHALRGGAVLRPRAASAALRTHPAESAVWRRRSRAHRIARFLLRTGARMQGIRLCRHLVFVELLFYEQPMVDINPRLFQIDRVLDERLAHSRRSGIVRVGGTPCARGVRCRRSTGMAAAGPGGTETHWRRGGAVYGGYRLSSGCCHRANAASRMCRQLKRDNLVAYSPGCPRSSRGVSS